MYISNTSLRIPRKQFWWLSSNKTLPINSVILRTLSESAALNQSLQITDRTDESN